MMRRYCRSSCAALLAGMLALCVIAPEAWAGCNPPGGVATELLSFTVKDHNNTGNSVTATPSSNPKTLYICGGSGDTAEIEMSAAVGSGGSLNHVGWRIEQADGPAHDLVACPSTPPLPTPPAVSTRNEGNFGTTGCNPIPITLYPSATFRIFHIKVFCDGKEYCKYDGADTFYEDTATPKKIIEVDVVVLKVDLTAIKFNHKGTVTYTDNGPDTETSDGLNIRASYSSDLGHKDHTFAGEWVPLWGRNEPFLYVKGKTVTIKARFTIEPSINTTLTIGADSVNGIFPDVIPKSVAFSGGVSVGDADGYVEFDLSGKSHEFDGDTVEDVDSSSDSWNWSIDGMVSCAIAQSGPHRCYCVYLVPQAPWYTAPQRHPWVNALDFTVNLAGCDDDQNPSDSCKHITQFCHGGWAMVYDRVMSLGDHNGALNTSDFLLTTYITTPAGAVNCYDQSAAVFLCSALLGLTPELFRILPYGYIQSTALVGHGLCNNPMDPPSALLVGTDDVAPNRSKFNTHAVVRYGSYVFDATCGPHVGTEDPLGFAQSAIDISTLAERSVSPDTDSDGILSASEVNAAITVGSVTGMH